jgi:hypothetical protein
MTQARVARPDAVILAGPTCTGKTALALRLAELGVGLRQRCNAAGQRPEIKHRAADEQWHPPARVDCSDRRRRIATEPSGRVGCGRITEIDQVVRHCVEHGPRRLGRADVHAAVDLRRVDADDLDRKVLREPKG